MIRPWETKDSLYLWKLLQKFLESQIEHGWQVENCPENIRWFLQLGTDGAKQGDPHLVYERNEKIIAFIQMGEALFPLRLKQKTAEIFSMYTLPEFRREFISIELVRKAAEIAVDKGYESIISTVFTRNQTMLKNMFYNPAIWPTKVFCEWSLENDPQFVSGKIIQFVERVSA